MSTRRRLDHEMVRRGLSGNVEEAARLVEEHRVTVEGAPALTPERLVTAGESIRLSGPARRFVSRGGEKLEAALDRFGVSCEGARVLDAGSSTGGFTDCVLQRGAAEVHAVDVGYGQLHDTLRRDPRVVVHERTDVREVRPATLGGEVDLVVADLSFISVRSVAASLVGAAAGGADLVVLVKPQFEVGRAAADEGRGVITDPDLWRQAVEVAIAAFETAGADMMGSMVSPRRGAQGNTEFLVHLCAPDAGG